MTRDQKRVLRTLAMLVGVKIILYASICYSAKHYRKAMTSSDPA